MFCDDNNDLTEFLSMIFPNGKRNNAKFLKLIRLIIKCHEVTGDEKF